MTNAMIASPVTGSGPPTTAASATAGCDDEGALDLGRREPMAGDVHHVVDAAEQPEVALLVALRAVAGEVHAREAAPVRLLVPLRVAVDAAEHRRPRPLQHEIAAATERHGLALAVDDVGLDAGEREGRASRASSS